MSVASWCTRQSEKGLPSREHISELQRQFPSRAAVLMQLQPAARVRDARNASIVVGNSEEEGSVRSRFGLACIQKGIERPVEDAAFLHENRERLMQPRGSEFQPASGRMPTLDVPPRIEPWVIRRLPEVADQKATGEAARGCPAVLVIDFVRHDVRIRIFRKTAHVYGLSILQGLRPFHRRLLRIRQGTVLHEALPGV